MRYYVLFILVSCAAYATASVVASGISAAVWPLLREYLHGASAAVRARAIAVARLAPIAAGAAFATIIGAAFVRFEPLDTTEAPGLFLASAASFTLMLVALAATRIARATQASARCNRLLRLGSRRIVRPDGTSVWLLDTAYPVAAVTGLLRPRMILSTRLLEECTDGELDAIVRHELAHIRRRDNVLRAAILCLPNPLAFSAAGRQMQQAWAAAAEEAADDAAAGDGTEMRTVLASALVRVAKMSTAPPPDWMPALTFYEATNLENRVRRLLDSGGLAAGMPLRGAAIMIAIGASCAFALTEGPASQVHTWMELAVQYVP